MVRSVCPIIELVAWVLTLVAKTPPAITAVSLLILAYQFI